MKTEWKLPAILGGPGKYLKKADAIDEIMAHWSGPRRLVIQAGAHIGIWPMRLAELFDRVLCFEAETENADCCAANLAELESVRFIRGAVSDRSGHVRLAVHGKSTAVHHIASRGSKVPSYRIDDFCLDDVDAVFLDIEGAEIAALCGATRTLERCKPMVVAEECQYVARYGHKRGDIEKLLQPLGYRRVARVGDDLVFIA